MSHQNNVPSSIDLIDKLEKANSILDDTVIEINHTEKDSQQEKLLLNKLERYQKLVSILTKEIDLFQLKHTPIKTVSKKGHKEEIKVQEAPESKECDLVGEIEILQEEENNNNAEDESVEVQVDNQSEAQSEKPMRKRRTRREVKKPKIISPKKRGRRSHNFIDYSRKYNTQKESFVSVNEEDLLKAYETIDNLRKKKRGGK